MDNATLQLAELLIDPKEAMDVEIKAWLDFTDKEHCGILAKAAIALANHGGGTLIIGFEEDKTNAKFLPAINRPANLKAYGQDAMSAIIAKHVEPNFHCDVYVVTRATDGAEYPVIRVPASTVPIRSKVDSANGTIKANVYYVRRPGPKSEQAGTGHEWDTLIRRCVTASRAGLLDAIRSILGGAPIAALVAPAVNVLDQWEKASHERWESRIRSLPANARAGFPLGRFICLYEVVDVSNIVSGRALIDVLRSAPRKTGWPPFVVIERDEMAPLPVDGCVESWFGNATSDPLRSDFWRASPEGKLFLIRGFQEDALDFEGSDSGKSFDLVLPVWRIAECLIHAEYVAEKIGAADTKIRVRFAWEGLAGRSIVSTVNQRRTLSAYPHNAAQDRFSIDIETDADEITNNLPEIVQRIVTPLFQLFDFFELPPSLAAEEIGRMLGRRT